jgi:hypothetical protein
VQGAAAPDAVNGERLVERWVSAGRAVTNSQRQAYPQQVETINSNLPQIRDSDENDRFGSPVLDPQ